MSKRPREEEEEERPSKRAKLHTNGALEAVLELMWPDLPKDLLYLVIDLTAPSPLRQFADDPEAPFFEPPDLPVFCSDLYEATIEQIFAAFATGWSETYQCRVMGREDFLALRRAMKSSLTEQESCHDWIWKVLKHHGLPHRFERSELSLDGFIEAHVNDHMLTAEGAHGVRKFMRHLADHLEPVIHYKV